MPTDAFPPPGSRPHDEGARILGGGTLHVVGAGLAGLACAVAAARAGTRVVLHESAGHAGGRCRSFRDDTIDRVIDNGTHLLMGVNKTALAFARCIGGDEAMEEGPAVFPFVNVATRERWTVSATTLISRPLELMQACGLPWTAPSETVAMRLRPTRSFRRVWEPLCVAALNTAAEDASARLFAGLLRMAVLGGRQALVPWVFSSGLSSALVAPAVATLAVYGAEIRFRHRLIGLGAGHLEFDDGVLRLGPNDRVVLALPPWALTGLLEEIPNLPTRAIVNAHFRLAQPAVLPGGRPFLGVTGGLSQWLALRGDVLSVTVSAADALAAAPAPEVGERIWREVAPIIGHAGQPQPPTRIMKERRATIAHTPDDVRKRPGAHTQFPNLYLAGDWLAGPWPCTIEAAVTSGLEAARLALGQPALAFTA